MRAKLLRSYRVAPVARLDNETLVIASDWLRHATIRLRTLAPVVAISAFCMEYRAVPFDSTGLC